MEMRFVLKQIWIIFLIMLFCIVYKIMNILFSYSRLTDGIPVKKHDIIKSHLFVPGTNFGSIRDNDYWFYLNIYLLYWPPLTDLYNKSQNIYWEFLMFYVMC